MHHVCAFVAICLCHCGCGSGSRFAYFVLSGDLDLEKPLFDLLKIQSPVQVVEKAFHLFWLRCYKPPNALRSVVVVAAWPEQLLPVKQKGARLSNLWQIFRTHPHQSQVEQPQASAAEQGSELALAPAQGPVEADSARHWQPGPR